jgi:hypothetical protein
MQVVCVDFHFVVSIEHAVMTVERLRDRGYVPIAIHRTDVTFVLSDLLPAESAANCARET